MTDNSSQSMVQFEDIIAENIVAMIRQEPHELSKLNELEFKKSHDDLDYLTFAILSLPSGNKVALVRHQNSPEPGTEICVSHNQQNVEQIIKEVLNEMNLTSDDLTWIHPDHEQIYRSRKSPTPSKEEDRPKNFSGIDFSKCALKEVQLERANLRKTIFKEAELGMANLKRADLREANLEGADLRGADLRGADLREADLRGADLRGADLREADLRGADLREADLREADLQRVDFQRANLQRVDFQRANLKNANLIHTSLHGSNFKDADIEEANLDQINLDKNTMWFHVIGLHKATKIPEELRKQPNYKYYIQLSEGFEKLKQGKLDEFKEKYQQVLVEFQEQEEDQEIAASLWNKIAWLSVLYSKHSDDESYKAALKAVELKPDRGNYHDTLGILALQKDFSSAIKEFEIALESKDVQRWTEDFKDRRKRWIESLKAGENPFTNEELKTLLDIEY
jgi:uncharacterized protein YjbI with pentapeptide repeats